MAVRFVSAHFIDIFYKSLTLDPSVYGTTVRLEEVSTLKGVGFIEIPLCYEIPWFYQNFKGGNLCFLNLYSVRAARILELSLKIMLSPPK